MAEADPRMTAEKPVAVRRIPAAPVAGVTSVFASILGLIALAWLILFVTKGRFLKSTFESYVGSTLERDVKVAGDFQLYLAPFDVKFLAEGMTISNPAWASRRNFFESRLIDTQVSTWELIFNRRRINWLQLLGGNIELEWDRTGTKNTWTFGNPDKPAEPFEMPVVAQAIVQGTEIRYRDPRFQLFADISVDTVRGRNTRVSDDIRFSGGGTLRGRRFSLNGSLLSPNETIAGGRNTLRLAAASGPTRMTLSGTLPGATIIEGADLRMGVRGPNLSLLFDFIGVAIPDTRTYRIDSNLTLREEKWRFTRLTGRFGDSDIGGWMTIGMPNNRLKIDADLRTRVLDIVDAGPFIGYDPNAIAARGAAGAIERVNGTPRVLPDAPLRVDAIKLFDADVDYRVRTIRAPNVPISNVRVKVDLERSLLALSPLTFDMAGGKVASDISINARRRPVFTKYDIRMSPTPAGKLLARWGLEESGTTGTIKARVQMTGEGDTIRKSLATSDGRMAVIVPKGAFWTRNIQLAELDIGTFVQRMFEKKLKEPIQVNCGLIAFTVRDGIAAADPILIDTQKNVMLGRGGFSFKNESLDLRFRADSKKFSLFAGQSPVGIGGYFAQPGFDIVSSDLVARGAAGVGLLAVGGPAAVLAFVDVGDAESAACGPVLAGARASAQREKDGDKRDDVGRGTTAKSESGKQSKEGEKKQRKKFLGIF